MGETQISILCQFCLASLNKLLLIVMHVPARPAGVAGAVMQGGQGCGIALAKFVQNKEEMGAVMWVNMTGQIGQA